MNDLTINMPLLPSLSSEYETMISKIKDNYPAIKKGSDNFYKSQSQFMDNILTVSCPTDIRNLRQILAEINKSKQGLEEAYFGNLKKEIEIRKKKSMLNESSGFDREMLGVEILELESQMANTQDHMKAAVRKISAYITQYNNILFKIGKADLTEEDFEEDEERYHIMRAFEQGLCAARSHGGVIDEGNQIYFYQIGINGMVAQSVVTRYLQEEMKILEGGQEPAHEMTVKFLEYCAKKFKGCARVFSERKGMVLIDKQSLHINES